MHLGAVLGCAIGHLSYARSYSKLFLAARSLPLRVSLSLYTANFNFAQHVYDVSSSETVWPHFIVQGISV